MKQALFAIALVFGLCGFAQQSSPPQGQNASQPSSQGSDESKTAPSDAKPDEAKAKTQSADQKTATQPAAGSKGCLAVKPIGSHAFRNIMLAGVAGALISKQQYQVVDVVDYPTSVGTKFHGNDLQTITSNGTKVVILDKHYKEEDLKKACH